METFEDKLKRMTAWDAEPELTETEIDELLAAVQVADENGASPQNDDWDPTYDLNSAAASGWLIKAARAANTTETEPDSLNVSSKIFDNCMQMVRIYSRKRIGSIKVAPSV
jgi:hypothetical protein